MPCLESCNPSRPDGVAADAHSYADPCATCVKSFLHVRVVHDGTGAPMSGITVKVSGKPDLVTAADGWVRYDPIAIGTYDVSARDPACVPDPAQQAGVVVAAGGGQTVTLRLTPLELRLHVDADRDGTVDADWTDGAPWEAGAGKKGAIVLVNSDRDDPLIAPAIDRDNAVVDGAADLSDIAPLALRKTIPGRAFPAGSTARLSASPQAKIRIFDSRAAGAAQIVGLGAAAHHDWDLAAMPDETLLGMEATDYPDDASGVTLVTLTLAVTIAGGASYSQSVKVRVAPWLCHNHKHKTLKVHVLAVPDNASFIGDLRTAVTGAGATLVETPGGPHGDDRWMQDVMEPGFSTMPRVGGPTKNWHTPATLRTMQTRGAEHYVRDVLLGADHGFTEAGAPTGAAGTMNSYGNLECSPPFTHPGTGRDYKFGRIVHGGSPARQMLASTRNFFARQKVQEPFQIDTSWLVVGHVDEIVSFLPVGGAFKVVLASPSRAMSLITAAPAAAKMLQGYRRADADIGGNTPAAIETHLRTVKYKLDTAGKFRGDASMVAAQTFVQGKIDSVKTKLKAELGLADADFIEFPVLFEKPTPGVSQYIAYTAGSVNMLVINKGGALELCVPKPFGPVHAGGCAFERDIRAALAPHGVAGGAIHFIDDISAYHWLQGEIHCGTNSEREAPDGVWWWEMDWV